MTTSSSGGPGGGNTSGGNTGNGDKSTGNASGGDANARTPGGMTAAGAVGRITAAGRGRPAGARALHARGRVYRATFTPSGELRSLTTAAHLVDVPSDVLVRFSNGAADPGTPDTLPGVRGMVVRFLADGQPMHDLVAATFRALGTRDSEGFVELVEVLGHMNPRATGVRRIFGNLAMVPRFIGFARRHPESRGSMREFSSRRAEASFAQARYDGVDAYLLVDGEGHRTSFRYRLVPAAGEAWLTKEQAKGLAPQFLFPELDGRLAKGPVTFTLAFQLGDPADSTQDPSVAWPDSRRLVTAGTLQVRDVAPDSAALEQETFDPTRVPAGVELSDDPVLAFRGHVYRLAGERRRAGR